MDLSLWTAPGFEELTFRLKQAVGHPIYTAHASCGTVYLHVHAGQEYAFTAFILICDSEGPHCGSGNTPQEAFTDAMKGVLGLPHGAVRHPEPDDLPF